MLMLSSLTPAQQNKDNLSAFKYKIASLLTTKKGFIWYIFSLATKGLGGYILSLVTIQNKLAFILFNNYKIRDLNPSSPGIRIPFRSFNQYPNKSI